MRKYFPAFLSVVLINTLFSFWSCNNSSADARVLKFNLEKGKGYDYDMLITMSTKAENHETKMSIDGSYSMNVSDIQGNVRSITTAYKHLKMNIETMGITIDQLTEEQARYLASWDEGT